MNATQDPTPAPELEFSDQDIFEAMQELPDYLDISTEDFRALYHRAYRHAQARVTPAAAPPQPPQAMEPPRVAAVQVFRAWIGSLIGIALLAGINRLLLPADAALMMIGSFGATAALLFGAPRSPFSQPRNVIGGHIVSALAGVLCWNVLGSQVWLAGAVAVATAVALMHLTRTMHPPGGATALIAVIGSAGIHQLGFMYVLTPATVGPLVLCAVALVVNNVATARRYPEVWF